MHRLIRWGLIGLMLFLMFAPIPRKGTHVNTRPSIERCYDCDSQSEASDSDQPSFNFYSR